MDDGHADGRMNGREAVDWVSGLDEQRAKYALLRLAFQHPASVGVIRKDLEVHELVVQFMASLPE